ncbi:NirD/YgiW/YdeI family stress tolerance protein [Zobellella aerophila]|uniref:Bacterial OB-fold domain-containing protein n=1 Tax=Zobellella aerophila TaxID=870480 RepID=A0ABP6VHP1_9GAMM
MRNRWITGLIGLGWLIAIGANAHEQHYQPRHDHGYTPRYEHFHDRRDDGRYDGRRDRLHVTSVARARRMHDDRHVLVSGHIVKRLRGDNYLFRDDTGTIRVEIDDDDWRWLRGHRRDRLLLWATVDRDRDGVELEVDRWRVAR